MRIIKLQLKLNDFKNSIKISEKNSKNKYVVIKRSNQQFKINKNIFKKVLSIVKKQMTKNRDFDRLRILEMANKQLEELESLKYKLTYQEVSEAVDKQELCLIERSNNLIQLYQKIISFYPSQFVSENDSQTCNASFLRSHSRSRVSEKIQKNQRNDIKTMVIHEALSCTIAYIYTNLLNNFEEGSVILLKSKGDINQLIEKLSLEKELFANGLGKCQWKNLGQKGGRYEEQSQVGLSRFCYNEQCKQYKIESIGQWLNQVYLSYIRVNMNLVISLILENRHPFAIEIFNEVTKFIRSIQVQGVKQRLIRFIYKCWFNIDVFTTWREKISSFRNSNQLMKQYSLTLQKAFTLALFIFNSDLFQPSQSQNPLSSSLQSNIVTYPVHFIEILQKSINIFTQNKLYNLSFFTLRHLLQSPISPQFKQKYYIQLSQMLQNKHLNSNILLQNIESVQTFKSILYSLNQLEKNIHHHIIQKGPIQLTKSKIDLFKLVIKLQMQKIQSKTDIDRNEKQFLLKKLQTIKNQTKVEIITSMLNQKLAQHLISQVTENINKMFSFAHNKIHTNYKAFISGFKSYQYPKQQCPALIEKSINTSERTKNKSQLKLRTVSPNHSRKYLKVISTSVLTEASVIYSQTCQKNTISQSNLINIQKKVSKMVRFCEHGAFLNKRNFNTDGGQSKFIKITHDKIKWSKNPQKIDQSSHSYPLKDIKGIIYGKVAPNWKKSCNNSLKEELCFSLILQKRTMDFCCKNYKQIQSWVCGISNILKKQNPQIVGYTPGKMRWRKMFANLREAFIQPLKLHERNNFYFQNAYSLILFKKNQYKLPSNQRIL